MSDSTTTLNDHERRCVRRLTSAGWPPELATVGVVMATRRPTRPRASLVDWLTQFPGLESRDRARKAMEDAASRGWLVEQRSPHGLQYLVPTDDIGQSIAAAIGDDSIADDLAPPAPPTHEAVRLIGPLVGLDAYDSYLERLSQARVSIDLPVMRPSSEEGAATIIQSRAEQGVPVRMLIASDAVVANLWGEAAAQSTRYVRESWVDVSRSCENFQLRVCHDIDDMRLATCVGIDRSVVRWDVYDHKQQRTLDGTMVEIASPPGLRLNLVDVFYEEFERAWSRGRPLGRTAALRQRAIASWQWWATVVFLAAALVTVRWVPISGILGSVAATFLVNAMVSSGARHRAERRRRRAADPG